MLRGTGLDVLSKRSFSRRHALQSAIATVAFAGSSQAAEIRLDKTLAFRLQNGYYRTSEGTTQTFSSLYNLEAPPNRVRLIWFNDQPEPLTIDAAVVASTAAISAGQDGMAPVDRDGRENPALWRRVTFPRSTEGQAPDQLILPAHPGPPGQPLLRLSDWIEVPEMPRRDGGPGALLLVRCFSKGKIRFSYGAPPDRVIGRTYRAGWSVGNAAAPPYDMGPQNRDYGVHACYGLQYTTSVAGASVIGIGASIMESSRSTGTTSGYGFRACVQISTPRLPVSYFNEGYSGRKSVDFDADGLRDIALLRPQVALIQAWDQNDLWTREAADTALATAQRLMEATRQVGGVPILVTAAPVFVGKPRPEQFRQESNARVREMAQRGIPMLDLDAIWGNGSVPAAYRPEYDSGDQTHPNDAAAIAAARVLAPMLRRILGAA